MRVPFRWQFGKKTTLISALVVVVLAAASVTGIMSLRNSHRAAEAQKDNVITHSTDQPEETKPSDDYHWQGRPNDPRYITLPTTNSGGYIQKVGVDQNKQVAVPNNVHMAGWFVDSVRPGNMGLSIIDGHVDGRVATGIFKQLAKLKEGDEFTVEMGDSSKLNYRVKKVVSLSIADTPSVLFSQDPSIKNQLNLITCGGRFDTKSRSYDKRIVVVSEQIQS